MKEIELLSDLLYFAVLTGPSIQHFALKTFLYSDLWRITPHHITKMVPDQQFCCVSRKQESEASVLLTEQTICDLKQ